MTDQSSQLLADGLQFPEGPMLLPDGSLIVVEIRRGTLTHIEQNGSVSVMADLGGGPNGAALGPDGACYICNNGGFSWRKAAGMIIAGNTIDDDYSGGRIERVDVNTGKAEVLYDSVNGRGLRGPNDIVFDQHGGFWFTDLGKVRDRDLDRGGVYYAKADGSFIAEVVFPMGRANGIGLSPDGNTLYVAETDTARLWAWPITAPGELARIEFPLSPNGGSLLYAAPTFHAYDSLAVEADGNICVATLMGGGITVCSPDGDLVEFVGTDDPYTTNICFGGRDMRDAYITLSGKGQLIKRRWPRPGLLLNEQPAPE